MHRNAKMKTNQNFLLIKWTLQKKKQRKYNFSTDEIRVLIEEYEAKRDIFEGNFSNTLTNIKKKSAWEEVNALGVDSMTVEEIKIKWKNLCSSAKGSSHEVKKSTHKTGGGPAPKPSTETEERIIGLFEGRPSFEGID